MIQVISELLMNYRTSYLRTANCGILADEFRTLSKQYILYLDLENQKYVHWHAMNTYFTNANTTEISWAKRTKNVTKEKLVIPLIYEAMKIQTRMAKQAKPKSGFHESSSLVGSLSFQE
ncbi:hypothetical protein T07_7071 [Trichinella nelsoni]|uniref:Uncharacterized protein n=1 Tax=Trichinella nelsoni TaxID=6336 RepID=A0A0V0RLC1_9BILA|nr:hypothetical protein T07_7071 [Trichinella nelsoni]